MCFLMRHVECTADIHDEKPVGRNLTRFLVGHLVTSLDNVEMMSIPSSIAHCYAILMQSEFPIAQ